MRLWLCRYLNHPLWYRADGGIHCYRDGKTVGRWMTGTNPSGKDRIE